MLISIVIPTVDNWESLSRCVAWVKERTTNYELIIVDNGDLPRGYVPTSDQGMRAANGEIILVLNDDTEVYPNWDVELRAWFEADPKLGLSSCSHPLDETSHRNWDGGNGYALAIRKACFDQVGGFGAGNNYIHWRTDTTYCHQVAAAGWTVARCETSFARHHKLAEPVSDRIKTSLREFYNNDYGHYPGW